MDNWIVIESRYTYESPHGSMRLDTCRMPNGRVIKDYNVCEYSDWVDIVAINEENELVMVKQYRHGAGKYFLEVVAGTVEEGEAPEDSIVRELREETGYICLYEPILLGRFHHNPARQNNILHIYFCDNIEKKYEQDLDDIEDIEVIHVPFDKIDDLIRDGTITQLSSVSAINLAKNFIRSRGTKC